MTTKVSELMTLSKGIIETLIAKPRPKITIFVAPKPTKETLDKVTAMFNTGYRAKFIKDSETNPTLSIYEEAAGFTLATRKGSRAFCSIFGDFFEDLCAVSPKFEKAHVLIDGDSTDAKYECKSRFNTMKASTATKEITPKLQAAINEHKNFYLLVATDSHSCNRNIPLHKGHSLSDIRYIDGYDETKHRWVSGDEVYKLLFPRCPMEVKAHVLDLLKSIKKC